MTTRQMTSDVVGRHISLAAQILEYLAVQTVCSFFKALMHFEIAVVPSLLDLVYSPIELGSSSALKNYFKTATSKCAKRLLNELKTYFSLTDSFIDCKEADKLGCSTLSKLYLQRD